MFNKRMKLWALPAMLVALTTWACTDAAQTLAPSQASHTDGLLVTSDSTLKKYNIANGLCDGGKIKTDEKIIQPTAGGNVGIAGNVLIVPAGAVLVPTKFVMTGYAAGCTGSAKLQVDLTAWQQDAKGEWKVNVGELGFLQPLKLRLNYETLTDSVDPANLRIIWVKADGGQEVYSSKLDPSGRTVSTELIHFSDYALAWP